MDLSGYRSMWVIAMFDLPVDTAEGRREYTRFRKALIRNGFSMMQYSVYIRHTSSRENAAVHIERVQAAVPPQGEIRVLTVTDAQFARMRVFWGKERREPEEPPTQLGLF